MLSNTRQNFPKPNFSVTSGTRNLQLLFWMETEEKTCLLAWPELAAHEKVLVRATNVLLVWRKAWVHGANRPGINDERKINSLISLGKTNKHAAFFNLYLFWPYFQYNLTWTLFFFSVNYCWCINSWFGGVSTWGILKTSKFLIFFLIQALLWRWDVLRVFVLVNNPRQTIYSIRLQNKCLIL